MSALDNAIRVAVALREQGKFIEAIDLIERALADAPTSDSRRVDANREGLRAAKEANLPQTAQRFSDAISIPEEEPSEDEF